MLTLHSYMEETRIPGPRRSAEYTLPHSVLDIMDELGISGEDMSRAIRRVLHACASLGISFEKNFMRTYRCADEMIIPDWKLSSLGCYLVIINCDPVNEHVARAQLHFLQNTD